MNSITMKLTDMVRPEKNVRIHTEQQLREFERSVKMFGQIRPIVVDEKNVILAGNGLYETLLRMGYEEALVYQYTDLTENQKKKLMIADNKIFSLGIENLDTLNSFLEDLQGDLDIPGFDSEKLSEYGTLDESEIQAIRDRTERSQKPTEPNMPDSGSSTNENPQNTAITTTSDAVHEEQDEETAEVKKFVICPKCGEKIWL